jgi:YesN/AraC family two-component response regulator
MFVKSTFADLGYHVLGIEHGEVSLDRDISTPQLLEADQNLRARGLEVIMERKNEMVEQVKEVIREMVNLYGDPQKINLSDYLSNKLNYNYSYLSNVFSKVEGMTIREFGIGLRIEQVKRMLVEDGLDLVEISCRLNYSSAAYLGAQFKKNTGMTSSEYKRAHHDNHAPA